MDIVAISGNSLGKSYYFGTRSGLCERIFDAVDDFSPGFERKFLKYMPVRTETEIVTILTGYILGANPSCTTSDLENITT